MALSNGTGSGGDYIKPEDYRDAKAVLIEPSKILHDQPSKFGGTRNIAVADVTIFNNANTLDGQEEPIILRGARLTGQALVRDLEGLVGEGTVGKFFPAPNSKGSKPIWVTRPVDQAIYERVAAYVEKRDADLLAAAGEEPEWMK